MTERERVLREALGRAVVILQEWRSGAWPDEQGFVHPVDRMSHTDLFLEFDAPEALAERAPVWLDVNSLTNEELQEFYQVLRARRQKGKPWERAARAILANIAQRRAAALLKASEC